MIILASTSDLVRVVTTSTANTDVHASFVDYAVGSDPVPDNQNTLITTATITTVVSSPAASTFRTVKTITIRNKHASTSQDVTVLHSDGTNIPEPIKATLPAGYALHYDEGAGWSLKDAQGRLVQRSDNLLGTASSAFTTVVLASDVANADATPNTIANVTGLSFAVTAGNTYWFRFVIMYTSAATTTGSLWTINGPAITQLIYRSEYSLTTSSRTINEGLSAYDTPTTSNATSAATTSNVAVVEGFLTPSANGTLIARLASEVGASAITAKAGSIVHYQQVL